MEICFPPRDQMRSPKLRSRVALPTRSYVRCGPANEASRAKKAKAPPPSEEGSGRRSFYVHKEDGQKENSLTPLRSQGPGFVPGHSMRHRRPPLRFLRDCHPAVLPALARGLRGRKTFLFLHLHPLLRGKTGIVKQACFSSPML